MSRKVTMHSGRTHADGKSFDPRHNDRNFDVARAKNIDMKKLQLERYWNVVDQKWCGYYDRNRTSFSDAELSYYTEMFGRQLEETNAKYKKNRHPEKVKSMQDWMYCKQNCPEECYVQIGDSFGHPDMEQFHECFMEWLDWQKEWSQEHGNPFTILNVAEHFSEEVPQAHIRRVWSYVDEDGKRKIGQEKALKMAGVELPESYLKSEEGSVILGEDNRPVTAVAKRDNNRKMTFDSMARAKWIEIVRKHGIEVDDTPRSDVKHNLEKKEAIIQQLRVAEQDAEKEKQKAEKLVKDNSLLMSLNDSLQTEKTGLEMDVALLGSEKDLLSSEQSSLQKDKKRLTEEKESLTKRNSELFAQVREKQRRLLLLSEDIQSQRQKQKVYEDQEKQNRQFEKMLQKLQEDDFVNIFLKRLGSRKVKRADGSIYEKSYLSMYQEALSEHVRQARMKAEVIRRGEDYQQELKQQKQQQITR